MSELKKPNKWKSILKNNISLIGLILVFLIFTIWTEGQILEPRKLINVFNKFFSIGLGAMGVTFLMSLGELDLSVGAIVGISAAMGALASNVSIYLIMPVAILTGIFVGFINGFMISKLHVESFIGTLAVSFVARGLTTWFLNGSVGIPVSMVIFDENYIKIPFLIATAIILFLLFELSPFGKHCRAIGSSEEAARQSGVKVQNVKLWAFIISGLICGVTGFFSICRTATASSNTGNAFEFDVLLAVLFGGMPLAGGWVVKFRSALIGAISMAFMISGMSLVGMTGLTQQVVEGIILILIVTVSFDRRNTLVIK